MAMKFRLEDVLSVFRVLESTEDAIPILGDEDAMKCLAAWSKTDQAWTKPRRKVPAVAHNRHAELWQWIIMGWSIDFVAIGAGSGLSQRVVHEKMEMLSRNRLIYPDGSTSKAARTALNIYVADMLGIKSKPKQAAAKKQNDDDEDSRN